MRARASREICGEIHATACAKRPFERAALIRSIVASSYRRCPAFVRGPPTTSCHRRMASVLGGRSGSSRLAAAVAVKYLDFDVSMCRPYQLHTALREDVSPSVRAFGERAAESGTLTPATVESRIADAFTRALQDEIANADGGEDAL